MFFGLYDRTLLKLTQNKVHCKYMAALCCVLKVFIVCFVGKQLLEADHQQCEGDFDLQC